MSKMRIEAQPSLEAFIAENGDICFRQESPGEKDKVIIIPQEHVNKVINWLQILQKEQEHRNTPDNFDAVD